MAKHDYRKGAIPYSFVAVPVAVLRSPEYMALGDAAKGLLLDLVEQYTGGNNGRLTPSWAVMQRRGWGGQHKLINAKRELLSTSFCIRTRKGKAPQTAEWVGFTWWKIDYHRTMEIDPKLWPYLNFQSAERAKIDPNFGREKLNPVVPKQQRSTFSGTAKTATIESAEMAL